MPYWVGQFGIEHGEAKEQTPWVGAFPDPGRVEEPSDLYVLAEPALPGSEEFCGEIRDAIGEAFHREKASLTGGILRALRDAHETLRDWNRKSLKDHRVAAGVSCVALRDGEAYLGQVAPAAAAFAHGGQVEVRRPAIPEALEPLGLNDGFWPDFARFEMAEGDRLLIAAPALLEEIPPDELQRILSLPEEDAVPELYRRARTQENCAALLIAAVPGEHEDEP
jgi:hypothetical protein